VKRLYWVLFGFFIGVFIFISPRISPAQSDYQGRPGRDLNQQQPGSDQNLNQQQSGSESDEGMGAGPSVSDDNKARVSGEVVSVDPSTGMIEIQNDQGMVSRFTIEGSGRDRLNQVKKGDQVDLVIVFQAVDVLPQVSQQDRSTQQPSG